MSFDASTLLGAVLLAALAGLDLASVLQTLLSRPLVAGSIAGWLVGDVELGLKIGVVLEFFALDVVPVGSSRYPDFGAAAVAAVLYAAGPPEPSRFGAAAGLGLAFALLAGGTLPVTRRLNARVVRAYGARLADGDPGAVRAVHWTCLGHDVARSGVVALVAIGSALGLRAIGAVPDPSLGRSLNLVVVAGAAWALAHGAMASGRSGARWRWALAGLGVGGIAAVLR